MKKRYATLIVALIILFSTNCTYAESTSWINAKSAILIDGDTKAILAQKNIDKQMYPASTTKIMTCILALEKCKLSEMVTVDPKTPYEIEGQQIYLQAGEVISMKDLINAALIQSANDAALVIAKHISGSQEAFAKLMNEKAKELGAKNTNFVTPNGLHDPNHVTTAYDMALIAQYAMQNETFRDIVGKYTYVIQPTNKQPEKRYLKSKNKLLYAAGSGDKITYNGKTTTIKYDGITGIKTGYTPEASNCLVSSASRNGQNLIAVIFNDPGTNIYIDMHKLLDYGFDNFTTQAIANKNEFIENVPIEHGSVPFVTAIVNNDVIASIPTDKTKSIKKSVIINKDLSVPISKDQIIGHIEYSLDNKALAKASIVAANAVDKTAIYSVVDNTSYSFSKLLSAWWFWPLVLFILWRIYIYKRRKKKRRYKSKYKMYTK